MLFLAATSLFSTHRVHAQTTANPPDLMTYQGFLVDGNGVALGVGAPKNYDVIFRIYDDASAGNVLWAEQQTVVVDKGYFSVLLGEGSNIGEARPGLNTLFANATASERWVGITVKGIGTGGADADILPRLRLLTTPYSFLAQKAVNASTLVNDVNVAVASAVGNTLTVNGPLNATSLSGSLNGANLSDGTVGSSKLANGSVTASKLAAGSVGETQLADGSVSSNKLADGSVTFNKLASTVGLWGKSGGNLHYTDGKVAIGTTDPGLNILQINPTFFQASGYGLVVAKAESGANIQINRPAGTGGQGLLVDNAAAGDLSTVLFGVRENVTSGNPTYAVHARCSGGVSYVNIGFTSQNLQSTFALGVNGAVFAVNFTQSSDARLKRNVQTLTNALSTVMRLRGVNFDWRKNEFPDRHFERGHQMGFIAQEVQNVLPDVVTSDDKGFLSIAYSEVIPLLTEAIKQQQTEIESQTEQIKSLESRLANLEAKDRKRSDQVAALESLVREKLGVAQQAKAASTARRGND